MGDRLLCVVSRYDYLASTMLNYSGRPRLTSPGMLLFLVRAELSTAVVLVCAFLSITPIVVCSPGLPMRNSPYVPALFYIFERTTG